MLKQLLDSLNIPNRATRFVKAPKDVTSYAVWFDSFASRGADSINNLKEHDYTIELYSYLPDEQTEKLIEDKLDSLAIPYEKSERYFLETEQLYQVVYDFTILEK